MARETVEIVRRASELLDRRDDWAAIADLFDPGVELHGTVGGLEEGKVVRGIESIIAAFDAEEEQAWDEHRIEPREFLDAGDRVVVLHHEYQRAKSGVELAIDTASIIDVRDGRIVRMQGFMDPAAALQAAGLSGRPGQG